MAIQCIAGRTEKSKLRMAEMKKKLLRDMINGTARHFSEKEMFNNNKTKYAHLLSQDLCIPMTTGESIILSCQC